VLCNQITLNHAVERDVTFHGAYLVNTRVRIWIGIMFLRESPYIVNLTITKASASGKITFSTRLYYFLFNLLQFFRSKQTIDNALAPDLLLVQERTIHLTESYRHSSTWEIIAKASALEYATLVPTMVASHFAKLSHFGLDNSVINKTYLKGALDEHTMALISLAKIQPSTNSMIARIP
jgi:hypothetical protein